MNILRWDKKLELGVALIDNQHKELLEQANALLIAFKCGDGCKKTKECLDFLNQYILYHFQAEEAFQVECNYPVYREHQAKHSYLATQVKFHTVGVEAADFSPESITDFYDFFAEWIIAHVLQEDMEFAIYYKSQRTD
ncbi:MAG: hemerythrin family protein [Angelakisella sp.]